jgi:hypothetical protein
LEELEVEAEAEAALEHEEVRSIRIGLFRELLTNITG